MALGNFSCLQERTAFRYPVALAFQLPCCCWGEKGNQSSPRLLNSAVDCVKGLQLSFCQLWAGMCEYQLLPEISEGQQEQLEPSLLISWTDTALGSL